MEEGEIVLDAFGGPGSTLIACERTGRRARVIEIDPEYVDVMVRRMTNRRTFQRRRASKPHRLIQLTLTRWLTKRADRHPFSPGFTK